MPELVQPDVIAARSDTPPAMPTRRLRSRNRDESLATRRLAQSFTTTVETHVEQLALRRGDDGSEPVHEWMIGADPSTDNSSTNARPTRRSGFSSSRALRARIDRSELWHLPGAPLRPLAVLADPRLLRADILDPMGNFDTIHTGERCGQTNALGKGLRDYRPGDRVVLEPVSEPGAEFVDGLPEVTEFQLVMGGGGFVVVRDGRIVEWAAEAADDLPLYDYRGHPYEGTTDGSPRGQEHVLAHAAQLEAGVETQHELLVNGVFGSPNLSDLEAAGDTTTAAERREEMAKQAVEIRRRAADLPVDCDICEALVETVPVRTTLRR